MKIGLCMFDTILPIIFGVVTNKLKQNVCIFPYDLQDNWNCHPLNQLTYMS